MSKSMTDEELANHCQNSTLCLNTVLDDFSKSPIDKVKKRAMLIAYWIKSYVYYLRNEDVFNSESVFRLKRGSIVQAEFGYRVGRELGGRHYAVVIDADNSIHRNTVTVIPLGSAKSDSKEDRYNILLGDGIYGPVSRKLDALIKEALQNTDEATNMEKRICAAPDSEKPVLKAVQRQKIANARRQISQAQAWLEEISRMKLGSIAKVDQIVTISKMRISNPVEKTHPLYGIRLTDEDMDKIDANIKSLYFKAQKKG